MLKVSASLLCLMILSGCGGMQSFYRPPPPVLPQTAASECRAVEDLCKLPEGDFASRSLDEQASMVLACHTINTVEYAKCALKHQALIDWAKEVAKQP